MAKHEKYINRKGDVQDTILHIYHDILREIKINDEFATKGDVKSRILQAERELSNVKKGVVGLPIKEQKAFTQQPRNVIKMLKGEDYHFTVNDGFAVYTVKKSTIEEKEDGITSYLLKRFRTNVNSALEKLNDDKIHTKKYIEIQRDALERLKINISKNISISEGQQEFVYDDYWSNKIYEEAYPIFQKVDGLSININI